MLDQLGRATHLRAPFWNPLGAQGVLSELDPLSALAARLWWFGETVDSEQAERVLDSATLSELIAAELVSCDDGELQSPWRIITYLQHFYLVTPPASDRWFDPDAPVAYIGPESFQLAQVVMGAERCSIALDLGTGSGLLGTLLPAEAVVATDVDPFALNVAKFNFGLGGHPHIEPVLGRSFEPVGDQLFDLIVSNPPFMPVPEGVALPPCGDGGPSGEETLRTIVPGLPAHLTPSGRAIVYGESLGDADEPHLARWLRGGRWPADYTAIFYVFHSQTTERVALRLTSLWQLCGASEEDAWNAWNVLQASYPSTHMHSFILDVRPGIGQVQTRRVPRLR